MGNEVQVQKTTGGLTFKVPAHLLAKIKAKGGNISTGGLGGNQLGIEGKRWVISVGGEAKPCTRPVIVQMPDGTYAPDPSGEREPTPVLNVIVIDQGLRGHIYYPGEYADGAGRAPDCWSEDGRKPSVSVAEPQCKSCDVCPKWEKGSKPTATNPNGRACREYKKLAVQVCSQRGVEYSVPPLSLKLAITSIWDERDDASMAEGWYAWDNYVKFLAANDCTRTNAVITQMRFAPTPHTQVQFKIVSFTEEDDFDKTTAMADTDEVKGLLTIFRGEPAKPQGKPLPQDDEPLGGPTGQSMHPSTVEIARRNYDQAAADLPYVDAVAEAQALGLARLRAAEEAEAAKHAAAAAEAKAVADAKAKKIADAKAALAALEAEEGGFDDGPKATPVVDTPGQAEEKKRTRRTKAEMEAARAAEAPKAPTAPEQPAAPVPAPAPATTAPLGGPVEIPAALAAALPAWD